MTKREGKRGATGSATGHRAWAVAAGLVLLFGILAWIRGAEPLGVDQGLFACFGRWVPEGWLPYRDIWDSKPPLILYTYPLAFTLLGRSVAALWAFESLWLLATALVVARAARRALGLAEAWIAPVLLVVATWAPGLGAYEARAQAEEFLAVFLLGAFVLLLPRGDGEEGSPRPGRVLLAGLLTGIATLYKVPAAVALGAWAAGLVGRRTPGRTARDLVLLGAGAALPWALAAGWFAANGSLHDMVEAAFLYNRVYARVLGEGLSLASIAGAMVAQLFRALPMISLAGVVGLVAVVARRRRAAPFLAGWFLLASAAVVLERQLAGYHFLLVVPPLALLAAHGLAMVGRTLGEPGRARGAAVLAALALAAAAAWGGSAWFRAYRADALYRLGVLDDRAYLRGFYTSQFTALEQRALVDAVRRRSRPGEGILVWGLEPGVYFLADRHPTTRYPFHHLLLTEAPLSRAFPGLGERRRRFLERLRRDPPALVLVGRDDVSFFEPFDSMTQLLRFEELRTWLFSGYRQVGRVGHFVLFERNQEGGSR